jgi:hypothetical protein
MRGRYAIPLSNLWKHINKSLGRGLIVGRVQNNIYKAEVLTLYN